MKKLTIASIVLVCSASHVQAASDPSREVSQIVEIPNMQQKQIYDASKIWIAKSFKSANSVIQYEDASTGTIVGKGSMDFPCSSNWDCMAHANENIFFTLKIDTKENKARLTFSDLLVKTGRKVVGSSVIQGNEVPVYIRKDKEKIESGLKKLIQQYEVEIKQAPSDSNW